MLKRSGWCRFTRRGSALPRGCGDVLSCQRPAISFSANAAAVSSRCDCGGCGTTTCAALTSSTLHNATRSMSTTHARCSPASPPTPAATTAATTTTAAAATAAKPRRDQKRLRIWTPDIMTHESLSYAACPICGATFHMHELLVHITAMHRNEDATYWQEQCRARLALYERVIGIPLPPLTSKNVLFHNANKAGYDLLAADESFAGATSSSLEAIRALLPTITAKGTYVCNWCTIKHAPFPTRDAFLLHVAKDHPKMDFDAVESLVPFPPSTSAPATSNKEGGREETNLTGGAAAASADGHSRGEGGGSAEAAGSAAAPSSADLWRPAKTMGGAGSAHAVDPEDVTFKPLGPSRRMPGVKIIQESNVCTLKLEPVREGVNVARSAVKVRDPAPLGRVTLLPSLETQQGEEASEMSESDAAMVAATAFFREHHFPCELCMKVFNSEVNLLQHLEGKHAPLPISQSEGTEAAAAASPTAPTSTSSQANTPEHAPSTTAASAPAEKAAAAGDSAATISVTCDLCRKPIKVFTLPSALFAHIRFNHRTVDPTYEAERMMREQRGKAELRCPRCLLLLPTVNLLREHLWDRHGVSMKTAEQMATNLRPTGTIDSAAPVAGTDELAAKYPCATLPPFTMKTRWWCDDCERGFRSAAALASHRREKHQSVSELYPCPACRRVFQDPYTLEDHVKAAHRSVSLVRLNLTTSIFCTHCNRGFISYESLHNHSVKHHHKNPQSPIRPIAKPKEAVGTTVQPEAAAASEAAPEIATPTKPRKVSRRKKATAGDA